MTTVITEAELKAACERSDAGVPEPTAVSQRPNCPKCGMRMSYEDDRDGEGNLAQSPWWECANCEERIGIAETGATDEQLVKLLRYPNREWTDAAPHWRRDTAPDKWTLCLNQMDFGAVSCEYNEKYHGGHYTWFLNSRLGQFPQSIEQGKQWLEAFFREWAKAFMANGGKPANDQAHRSAPTETLKAPKP